MELRKHPPLAPREAAVQPTRSGTTLWELLEIADPNLNPKSPEGTLDFEKQTLLFYVHPPDKPKQNLSRGALRLSSLRAAAHADQSTRNSGTPISIPKPI